jgi:hypothetical protein
MTQDEIIQFVQELEGVAAVTAAEGDGSPEIAWGDTFIYFDPDDDPANRMMPFATIVTKDYPDFDTASHLDRPGVFRLNVNVGRKTFSEQFGYPPAAHPDNHDRWDYQAADRLMPHPIYAEQGWAAIVNPGNATDATARTLLADAHARAARRHRAGRSGPDAE